MQMKKSVIAAAGAVFRGEKRQKNIFRAAFVLLLAAVIGALVCVDLFVFPLEYIWAVAYEPDISPRGEGELRVHFIGVGQGDCTLVEFPDGKTMIVDGGDEREETRMRRRRAVGGASAAIKAAAAPPAAIRR